jgi:hypothetical protein
MTPRQTYRRPDADLSRRSRCRAIIPCHAARAGTASGLNDVLLAAAVFAALGAVAGFAFGPDAARQPPPVPVPGELPVPSAPPNTRVGDRRSPKQPHRDLTTTPTRTRRPVPAEHPGVDLNPPRREAASTDGGVVLRASQRTNQRRQRRRPRLPGHPLPRTGTRWSCCSISEAIPTTGTGHPWSRPWSGLWPASWHFRWRSRPDVLPGAPPCQGGSHRDQCSWRCAPIVPCRCRGGKAS